MSQWGYRVCAGCNSELASECYSVNQWRKQVGVSRCKLCIQENVSRDGCGFGTGRSNENSRRAQFDFCRVFATGSFRACYRGVYTGGPRTGQSAIAKVFKDKYEHMSDLYFAKDEETINKAVHLISQFNGANFIDSTIRINVPSKWTTDGRQMFVEPFIENYEKFNSNSGWVNRRQGGWYKVLQALSHYTYHVSSGMFTLCDLQGGIYRDGVILSDPVICSRNQRFGPTDLGAAGISTFFGRHVCNRYCRREWTKPRDCNIYYDESKGTSMEYHPSQPSRNSYLPPMSGIDEDFEDY